MATFPADFFMRRVVSCLAAVQREFVGANITRKDIAQPDQASFKEIKKKYHAAQDKNSLFSCPW